MPELSLDHRAWDTQHFGYPVASISNSELDSAALARLLQAAQKQHYQLVYWASCDELDQSELCLREYRGTLIDRKTTYAKTILPNPVPPNDGKYQIIEWQAGKHSDELIELGVAAGLCSRFALDPRIAPEKFRALYEIWMRRSIARELSDIVLVVQEHGANIPLGMVTISMKGELGQIGLISVSEQQRGRGLGQRLIEASDRWMLDHGAKTAQVVTQLQNVAACRLYENGGYQIEKIEYLYHFWLPARAQALRT